MQGNFAKLRTCWYKLRKVVADGPEYSYLFILLHRRIKPMNKHQYYNWKPVVEANVPENMRIDYDFMIVTGATLQDSMASPRMVDMSTFVLLDKGESKMIIDMKEYSLKAPCLAVIMPGQIYQLVEKSEDISFRAVVMSKEFTADLFQYHGNPGELKQLINMNPILDLSDDMASYDTYYKILLNAINSPFKRFRLQSAKHLTISMLYHYVRKLKTAAEISTKADMLYDRFCKDVRIYYRTNRTLPFYASRLGIGTNLLTRIVKSKEGKTAAEYIDDITIIECKALLNSTEMSVQQISRALNFVSPSVFGKFFKRMTGMSPSDYRRDCR